MSIMNTSLVLLSIFFTTTSLMALVSSDFGASSLPRLHTVVAHSPSDDFSTTCCECDPRNNSSPNHSLHADSTSGSIDSTERNDDGDEKLEVRLETSDAPSGDFAGPAMMMLIIMITFVYFGAKFVNFVLLPLLIIIFMMVIVALRR